MFSKKSHKRSSSSAVLDTPLTLTVQITSATDLQPADSNGTSDPFCELHILNAAKQEIKAHKTQKTKVIKKTNSPQWNETFVFGAGKTPVTKGDMLNILLKDSDGKLRKAQVLGQVCVPVAGVRPGAPQEMQMPVEAVGGAMGDLAKHGGQLGSLRITVTREDHNAVGVNEDESKSSEDAPLLGGAGASPQVDMRASRKWSSQSEVAPPNTLYFTLVDAKGILAADKGGKSDPYCNITCTKTLGSRSPKYRTEVQKKTLHPKWHYSCRFKVEDQTAEVTVDMYDQDRLKDEFLGRIVLPISGLADGRERTFKMEFLDNKLRKNDKKPRGHANIRAKWAFAHDDESSEEDEPDSEDSDDAGEEVDMEEEEEKKEETEEEKEAREKREKEEKEALEKMENTVIKAGDYQVQVHIIEVRDLRPKDASGTSDPFVKVDVMGKKAKTPVQKTCLSAVFDEVFCFDLNKLDKEAVENGQITLRVMDSDFGSKDDLIGGYTFDMSYVYSQRDHELHRKWFGLYNLDDPMDSEAQGYLKASIVVVGPGEKAKKHDEEADMKADRAAEASGDISKLVMMPSNVKREMKFLCMRVHKAEHLPVMDAGSLGGTGIQAYARVAFGGNKLPKVKRKDVRKKTGKDRNRLRPKFHQEFRLPVVVPTMSNSIAVSIWDREGVGKDNCVAHTYLNFKKDVQSNRLKTPTWFNLYGAPCHKPGDPRQSGDIAKKMNTYPDDATWYRGRVLLSASLEAVKESDGKTPKLSIQPLHKKSVDKPQIKKYMLQAIVVSGSEIPGKGPFQVRVMCGLNELVFDEQSPNKGKGMCQWHQAKYGIGDPSTSGIQCRLPADPDQIPDIFVYLCSRKGKTDFTPFAYRRFNARQWMEREGGGFGVPCQWLMMREDNALDKLSDETVPGNLLIRLGFGSVRDAQKAELSWKKDTVDMGDEEFRVIRLNIYQARGLPAADADGMLDPYLKVKFGEQPPEESSKREDTCNPTYYETLEFKVSVPKRLDLAPQICVQLYDHDEGVLDKDDYCGCFFVNLTDAIQCDCVKSGKQGDFTLQQQRDMLPTPKWYDLCLQEPGDSEGSVLMSTQIYAPELGVSDPPRRLPKEEGMSDSFNPALVPEKKECFLEILALGLRSLKPYKFIPIQNAFAEISIDDPSAGLSNPPVTKASKRPTGRDPNFLEHIVVPIKLPLDALYAPRLKITARDTRLGGLRKPVIGTAAIDLANKLPWCPDTYQLPAPLRRAKADLAAQAAAAQAAEDDADESKGDGADELGNVDMEQENKTLEGLRDEAGAQVDTGAGVFGALLDYESETDEEDGAVGRTRAQTTSVMPPEMAEWEEEDDDPPKYMIGRQELEGEFEEELYPPFETYDLMLGQKFGKGGKSTLRVTGLFKGVIRIVEDEATVTNEPLFENLRELLTPQMYQVRAYFLLGKAFKAMDVGFGGRPGKSDPYLKLKVGKKKISDRKNYIDDETEPAFFRSFTFDTQLPGAGQMLVQAMDYDLIGSDDMIGQTVIDLEDRLFDRKWAQWGSENQNDSEGRCATKPIEWRGLYSANAVKETANPFGELKMWVDILSSEDAKKYPMDDVSLPPDQKFEVQFIVWKTKDVVSMEMSGLNDLYAKVWFEGTKPYTTDIHWRCKKGKGSFNYRMRIPITLGFRTKTMKFPMCHIQLWDKDIVKSSDCIAEASFDCGKWFRRAYKRNEVVEAWPTPKENDTTESPTPAPNSSVGKAGANTAKPAAAADAAAVDGGTDDGADESKTDPFAAQGAVHSDASQSGQVAIEIVDEDHESDDEESRQLLELEREKKEAEEQREKDKETSEFVRDLKEMSGLYPSIDPRNSTWIKMERKDWKTHQMKPMGQVCVSMKVVPWEEATNNPKGTGRSEPNHTPYCPPPSGRLKFSLNPFSMLSQLLGPSCFYKLMCFCCCVIFALVMIFAGTPLQMALQVYLA